MKKYKVCPSCKKHNLPSLLECTQCESDLTAVPVTDEETHKMQQSIDVKGANSEKIVHRQEMFRICECGAKNPVQSRKCLVCGEDISDVVPQTCEKDAAVAFRLEATDEMYVYEIAGGDIIIGREFGMKDYLKDKSYVSRRHAELIVRDNRLYIRNLSKTNYTYVNNKKIIEGCVTELHENDEIGLGGIAIDGKGQELAAYFLVRTSECM